MDPATIRAMKRIAEQQSALLRQLDLSRIARSVPETQLAFTVQELLGGANIGAALRAWESVDLSLLVGAERMADAFKSLDIGRLQATAESVGALAPTVERLIGNLPPNRLAGLGHSMEAIVQAARQGEFTVDAEIVGLPDNAALVAAVERAADRIVEESQRTDAAQATRHRQNMILAILLLVLAIHGQAGELWRTYGEPLARELEMILTPVDRNSDEDQSTLDAPPDERE